MSKLFKFKPTKEIFVVLSSWILVVLVFYFAFNIITIQRVALHFLTFGFICIISTGILIPVIWNTIFKKRPFSDLGIKKDKIIISIVLGIVFSVIQYFLTIANIETPAPENLIPLITMSLAVGIYENIFYRGWVQLKMEEFFGIIPGIVLSAVIYSLYHIGYGMHLDEMITLFIVGLAYSVIFRLTKNIFILFPFLTPSGALFSQINNGLSMPFEATYGFAIILVIISAALIMIYKKSIPQKAVSSLNKKCVILQ